MPLVVINHGGGGSPTAPAQFGTGDWSVADDGTSGDITITVITLPSDGGSAITDLEYQIDGGSWVSMAGTTTGDYPVSGLTDDVEVDVAIRAVNAIGNGTASATKPVTPTLSDPDFASVVLLLGFEGVDGATATTDESPVGRTMSFSGNAQLDTAQFKYGASSLLLDGTGDYLTSPDSADFDLGSGLFTIEMFIRPASVTGSQFLVAQWDGIPTLAWVLFLNGAALNWFVSTSGSNFFGDLAGGTLSTGTWYHVCVDYDGTTYRLYLDGAMVASSTTARAINNSTDQLHIGSRSGTGSDFFNGSIDEVRITKGVGRYVSDGGFTPPAAVFPRS